MCVLYLVSTHQANAKASCCSGINLLAKDQNVVNDKLLLFCILEMIIFRQLKHQLYDQIDDPHITLSRALLWLSLYKVRPHIKRLCIVEKPEQLSLVEFQIKTFPVLLIFCLPRTFYQGPELPPPPFSTFKTSGTDMTHWHFPHSSSAVDLWPSDKMESMFKHFLH